MGKAPVSTKHNIMPVQKGDQLTANHYNSMVEHDRDVMRKRSIPVEPIHGWTPFVHNSTDVELPLFSITALKQPYLTGADGYPMHGYYSGNYLELMKPTGEMSDVVVVNDVAMGVYASSRAIVTGLAFCQVLYTDGTVTCNYATTIKDDVTCLKASETGQCKIIWSVKREAGKQWSLVLLNTGGAGGSAESKIIGLCENSFEEADNGLALWKFSKSTIRGTRESYDEGQMIEAYLAPYIESVTPGGLYTLEWFDAYNGWVVVAGTCSKDTRDYTPYTTATITMHSTGSDSQNKVSGTVRSIGQHDDYATLEYHQITKHDLPGYPGRSVDMFVSPPTFALNSDHSELIYKDVQLKPGAYGIAVYQFVITDCNGSNKDVYTIAFRCIEENRAPTIRSLMTTDAITLRPGESKTVDICRVEDNDVPADTLSIYNEQYHGNNNLLVTRNLSISGNKVTLTAKAGVTTVGAGQIEFYIDDGHDLQCTIGEYEKFAVDVNVVNHKPEVTITHPAIHIERGKTDTFELGIINDPDGDEQYNIYKLSSSGIDRCVFSFEQAEYTELPVTLIMAEITANQYAFGEYELSFIAHDQYRVYSDGVPNEQKVTVVVDNPAPDTELSLPSITAHVSGGLEQDFIVGMVKNKQSDELSIEYLGETGVGVRVMSGYDIIDNAITLYLDIPQDGSIGSSTIRFRVNDCIGMYTNENPILNVTVTVVND